MSAIEESSPAAVVGKSTQGSELPVGDATRLLMLPQLPYADAVHAELLAAELTPSAFEAGLRRGRTGASELYVRAVWPVGAPRLGEAVRPYGLTIAWSHVTGWSAHDIYEHCQLLDVDVLADPRLIAQAAQHLAVESLDGGELWTPASGAGRWSEAVYLDIALCRFEERPVEW